MDNGITRCRKLHSGYKETGNWLPKTTTLLCLFVYRQTGMKKKLNSMLQFPDVIDMNEFMYFPRKEDGIYHLNAVLIHRGLSAHSGHYIAHILDKQVSV